MGNLTIELELVTNAIDCIINPNDYDESYTGIDAGLRNRFTVAVAGDTGKATNTSTDFEISNSRVVCDLCTLDNISTQNTRNIYLEGKGLPITSTTSITQSQAVKGSTDISVPVIRSVSKLVASFATFYEKGDSSTRYEYCDKEFCRFYHPHQNHQPLDAGTHDKDKDLEFQVQLGSKIIQNIHVILLLNAFIIYGKRLIYPCFINTVWILTLNNIVTVSLFLPFIWKSAR